MDKKLISEITRIGEMMGVKGSSLILESTLCPFCDVIMRRISDLSALATKNSDQIEFKYKVNELLERVKNEGNLTVGQKEALQTAINKLKEVESASDNVASFKSKVDAAIKQNDALSDVLPAKANLIDNNIMRQMDYSKIYQDPKLVNDFFVNSPKIKETMTKLDAYIIGPDFKTNLSKFKSVDEYAGKVETTLKERFRKDGFNETLSDGLAKRFKNYIKARVELEPNLNPFVNKIDDVVEPVNVNSVIKRRRKVGLGDETLEKEYVDRYNDIIKKNGVDLTEEEKLFKETVEEWKVGKIDDVGEAFKTKVGEPKVEATGGEDTIKSASAKDLRNLFERSASEVNIEDLTIIQKLREFVAANAKDVDSNMTIIKNVKDAIDKGKKVNLDEFTVRKAFESKGFPKSDIDVYIKKLNNPTKGNGYLDYFYWKYVEPAFKTFSALEIPAWIKRTINGKPPLTTQDLVNQFQKEVDKLLINFNPNKNYSKEIRELRIKFGKIRQLDSNVYPYYAALYEQWVTYMKKSLSSNEVALKNFEVFEQKLISQKEDFFNSSWRKMINKEVVEVVGEDGLPKLEFNMLSNPYGSGKKMIKELLTSGPVKAAAINIWDRAKTWFFTNVFRSPRQMEEYFIRNGYTKNNLEFNKFTNLTGRKNVAVANLLQKYIIKYIYVPTIVGLVLSAYEVGANALQGGDLDPIDGPMIENFTRTFYGWGLSDTIFEGHPEWYKTVKSYGLLDAFIPPVADVLVGVINYYRKESSGELKSGDEIFKEKTDEIYDGAVEKANTKANKVWSESDADAKEEIYAKSNYKSTEQLLSGGRYPNLTTEQQKFLLSRLSFDPTPNLTALRNIKVRPIPKDVTDFKGINVKDYIDSDSIEKSINSETVGNAVLQGKSGKKYVVIRTYGGEDPFKVLDKTNDNNIEKQGVAVVKPSYGEIKPTTDLSFISLNQFYNEYNDL
jgi:hypothetical protein